jgi:hypothetical protein
LLSLAQFARNESVLLIDNSLSHFQQVILGLFGKTRGCVITAATHTMQIFQTLNHMLLKISDGQARYKLLFDKVFGTVGRVLMKYDDVARTIAPKKGD